MSEVAKREKKESTDGEKEKENNTVQNTCTDEALKVR